MKSNPPVMLMDAVCGSIRVLRDLGSLLASATDSNALALARQAHPILISTADRLRSALKARPATRPRSNPFSETPWGVKGSSSGPKSGQASTASAIYKEQNDGQQPQR